MFNEIAGELWERTFDAVPDLIAILDDRHRIVRVNKAMAERLGRTSAECLGLACYGAVHGSACPPDFCPHARTLADGQSHAVEMHDDRLGGDFLVTTTPLTDRAGQTIGSVHVVRDITEQKRDKDVLQRNNARLKLLSDVAGSLLATDNPQAIVNDLCSAVMAHLDCQAFFNFIADSLSGRLHLNTYAGIPAEEARKIEWLDYGMAVCGCAARDGCRIVAEDIMHTPDPRTELVKSYGIQAYACHPLQAGDRVIGTLSFGTTTRTRFLPDELALMKTVADQVALALERLQQDAKLRRLNRTLQARSRSDQALMRATDAVEYMMQVCDIIVEDCGHAMVWIGLAIDDDGKTVYPIASAGFEAGYLDTLHVTWAETERGRGPTGAAIRTGQPAMCRDMRTDPDFAPWRAHALERGYASSLVLPLLADGAAFGAITIYAREPDAFPEEEISLLGELAGDLAYGINALYLREAHALAATALRQNEERYRSLFNGMTEGFALHELICDEQGIPRDYRFLEINPAFERLTGLRRDLVIGRTHNEVLPTDAAYWVETYGKVALTGESVHFENYSPALDQHFEVFAYCPRPGQFAVLFMDITARKHVEEKNAWLASFPERNPIPIIEVRREDGMVSYQNPAAARLFPDLRERGLRHPWLAGLAAMAEQLPRDGEGTAQREVSIGDTYYEQFITCMAETQQLRIYGFIITERKQAEETLKRTAAELARSNQELEQFAYVASHDLQEPLRAVAGYVSLLEDQLGDQLDEKTRQHIDGAIQGAARMRQLITDLLVLSRVGTQGKDFVLTDFHTLFKQALQSIRVSVEEAGATITHDPLPLLRVDGGQITQLLQNLLANAVKFHGERPPVVHLGAQQRQSDWLFSVRDNGLGIDPQYFERIFLIFQRLHTRKRFPGTGIGLAICRKIVERHHGAIWVESQPGEGSTFYFTIPTG